MNMPALSAAMNLRLFNPFQMNRSRFALSVVVKLRRYFQMLALFLKALVFIKQTLAQLQNRATVNQLINSRDVAGDFLKVRDRVRSLLSS